LGGQGRVLLPMYRERHGAAVVPAGPNFSGCPTDKAAEYLGVVNNYPKKFE